MSESPMLKKKTYHRGSLIDPSGNVSALCFKAPRAIDLKKASWTNREEAVTCPKCRAIQKRSAVAYADYLARKGKS